MALCPKCNRSFRVLEDETPEEHGCPQCGFSLEWEEEDDEEEVE